MKKGMADTNKQLYWTLFLIPLIGIYAFLLTYVVPEVVTIKTQQHDGLQDNIMQDVLLNSPECLAYKENNNIKAGHIDLNKYKEDRIHECLKDLNSKKEFILTLKFEEEEKEITSKNFKIEPRKAEYKKPVIVIDEEKQKYNAVLEINMMYK